MSVLSVIQLALAGLQSVIPFLTQNSAIEKVVSESISAIDNVVNNQSAAPETLAEIEALRTKKLW